MIARIQPRIAKAMGEGVGLASSASSSKRLASNSRFPLARAKRGLALLRRWLRGRPTFFELSPSRIARQLGLGHGAAVDIGYALRHWERLGYVIRVSENPARYLPSPKLILRLYHYGCPERKECDSNSACGLIGTAECPFLEGYGDDDSDWGGQRLRVR